MGGDFVRLKPFKKDIKSEKNIKNKKINEPIEGTYITPLFLAMTIGNVETFMTLIKLGADPDRLCAHYKCTPLQFITVAMSECNTVILEKLLSLLEPSQINIKHFNGETLLFAVKAPLTKFLIAKGADLHISNNQGITALDRAIVEDDAEKVRSLLQPTLDTSCINPISFEPIDINSPSRFQSAAPLFLAVHSYAFKALEVIIECGADIEIVDHLKKTALMWARERNNIRMVEMLTHAQVQD